MNRYEISSCKFTVIFTGTRREADREARRLNREYQPAFGVTVTRLPKE